MEFTQRALEGRAGGSCQGRKGLGPGLDSGQSRRPRQRTFTQATHVTCAPPLHVRAKRGSNWRVRSVLWPTPFLPSSLTIGRSRRCSLKGNRHAWPRQGTWMRSPHMDKDALPSRPSTLPCHDRVRPHLRPLTPRISSRASSITHHRPHPLSLSRALISGQWTRMASRTCPCQRKRVGWCVRDEAAARQSTLLFGGADNRCDLPPNAL